MLETGCRPFWRATSSLTHVSRRLRTWCSQRCTTPAACAPASAHPQEPAHHTMPISLAIRLCYPCRDPRRRCCRIWERCRRYWCRGEPVRGVPGCAHGAHHGNLCGFVCVPLCGCMHCQCSAICSPRRSTATWDGPWLLQAALKLRGTHGIISIGKKFRSMDDSGDHKLSECCKLLLLRQM